MIGRLHLLLLCSMLLVSMPRATSALALHRRATTCNGSSSLCDRLYSNVTYAGAHNSYAIGDSLSSNQNVSITEQLDAGIRMLQSQAHQSSNSTPTGAGIDLCHTSCSLFQGGALETWLGSVKTWTDDNPSEVVTLLIVNSDGLAPSQFASAFTNAGLVDKMYAPSNGTVSKSSWPTLGTMIDSGKTVVAFLSTMANFSSVDYLLDEFANVWENPYDQSSTPFNCSIDRIGQGVSDSSQLMYLSNQFLDSSSLGGLILTPNTDELGTTNSLSGTVSTSDLCASQHGTYPNFILTDYSTVPDYELMEAVAQINGVNYTAPASSSSGGSNSSGSKPSLLALAFAASLALAGSALFL